MGLRGVEVGWNGVGGTGKRWAVAGAGTGVVLEGSGGVAVRFWRGWGRRGGVDWGGGIAGCWVGVGRHYEADCRGMDSTVVVWAWA